MAVDRWFFGGGAEHTPESARRALYASTGGAEGVGGINDLQVVPLTTPGQGVRVLVGSALIKSRYVGGETQTYMGTVYTQETVSTTPTGSGQTRADLVVMRVEDPYAAGSTYPAPPEAERATAPYVYIRVISGVPANAKKLQDVPGYQNDSAVTLARINFPASTGTVTAGMITDLRDMAQPRRKEVVFARPRVSEDDGSQSWLTGRWTNGGEYFPGGGGYHNEFQVEVPEWANRMIVESDWMGVKYIANKDVWGRYWMEWGDEYRNHTWPNGQQYEFATQQFQFDSANSNNTSRTNWRLMDNRYIAAKLRGKTSTFVFKAGLQNGTPTDGVQMDALSGLGCRITFLETTGNWEEAL